MKNLVIMNTLLVTELSQCHHKFNSQCILLRISEQSTCPLCRDIVNKKKFDEIDLPKVELEEGWGVYSRFISVDSSYS